jgi:hypothetical protein
MLARIIAVIAHEILGPIAAEYRKLDAPELAGVPDEPASGVPHGELSCVDAITERAPGWDHDIRAPVTARAAGFGRPPGKLTGQG